MKDFNWKDMRNDADEIVAGDFPELKRGPYITVITDVEDISDREMLKVFFDIAVGELKGEFARQEKQFGIWPAQGISYRSYKDEAFDFFKSFLVAVERSNKNFIFDPQNPKCLIGKKVVANFGEEEYMKDGQLRTSMKCREFRSVEALDGGRVKLLEIKKMKSGTTTPVNQPVSRTAQAQAPHGTINTTPGITVVDDDLPF